MMKLVLRLTIFTLLLTFTLAAQKVGYNFDDEADFSSYKTFSWVKIDGAVVVDDLADQQIREAIAGELASKGLQLAADGDGDLHLGYQVSVDQQQQMNTMGTHLVAVPIRRGELAAWASTESALSSSTTTVTNINVGTFVLDIYDVKAHRLVWRGTATRTMSNTTNAKKKAKRIDKGVTKLLKNYPPTANGL
jgi:hypothetical protein